MRKLIFKFSQRECKGWYECPNCGITIDAEHSIKCSGGWIRCTDRLPKQYDEVLGCTHEGKLQIVVLHKDSVFGLLWKPFGGGDMRFDCIVAWLPLPEPYNDEPCS